MVTLSEHTRFKIIIHVVLCVCVILLFLYITWPNLSFYTYYKKMQNCQNNDNANYSNLMYDIKCKYVY